MAPDKVALSRKQIGGEVPIVVSEITDFCLYTGLFGTIDSVRMQSVCDKLTDIADDKQTDIVIIDLFNVESIDSAVAGYMLRLGGVLRLVGVTPIFCGIKSKLATTMVAAGVNMDGCIVTHNLKSALKLSMEMKGYSMEKK
ncbi:STAS domain-containing protein [Shewanella subflava]|uniref:STAS domain-containing protein n=1 Tax=Shewanella subflava TaxID=2986476 RepID=A0ABT3I9C0_9GAMM|nr:STAS domain-containing protein [Shewanella subflava]MCW3172630.1 STAS domain-containing protein [Shewanella subflava]